MPAQKGNSRRGIRIAPFIELSSSASDHPWRSTRSDRDWPFVLGRRPRAAGTQTPLHVQRAGGHGIRGDLVAGDTDDRVSAVGR